MISYLNLSEYILPGVLLLVHILFVFLKKRKITYVYLRPMLQMNALQDITMCALSQAMVMFHGKEKFSSELFDILSKLATDDSVAVHH